jgi:hypothetical protein
MNEYVLAAAIWSDETKTFAGVEKLHGADSHVYSSKRSGSPLHNAEGGSGNKNIWSGSNSVRPARLQTKGRSERQKCFV